jgi:G3E family GTPase
VSDFLLCALAGKTTLVNRMLTDPEIPFRIFILENEAGAISIDHKFLDNTREDNGKNGIFVMKNGCMCCSTASEGDEIIRVLTMLIELFDREDFDYIVIETSGLVDPIPLMQVILQIKNKRFSLDAVVTVVDSKNVLYHIGEDGQFGGVRTVEAERQIACADVLLLNKIDLAGDEILPTVRQRLTTINASALIFECSNADVPLSDLLNVGAFENVRFRALTRRKGKNTTRSKNGSLMDLHMDADVKHTKGVSSISIETEDAVNWESLLSWLVECQSGKYGTLFRVKGIFYVQGSPMRHVAQGVMTGLQAGPDRGWKPGEPRMCEIVFIGLGLDGHAEQVRAEFRDQCVVSG